VLTRIIIDQAMVLDLQWRMFKAIDKIRRGYLWRGRKDAKGGHCLVAWTKVTRPKNMGGLGISDLKDLVHDPTSEINVATKITVG
jgi:hypothetical protein